MFISRQIHLVLVLMGWSWLQLGFCGSGQARSASEWLAHDPNRPRPPVVSPARQALPVAAPEDAVVLFDGTGLDGWRSEDGGPARWKVQDGAMISVPESGYLFTSRPFGDVQLHLEWAAPFRWKAAVRGAATAAST